jgi:hypothetical protein
MSDKYLEHNKIFKNNIEYKFDEMIAKLAVLACNPIEDGVTNTLLDNAYTDNSAVYTHYISRDSKVVNGKKLIDDTLKLVKKYANATTFKSSTLINLFIAMKELVNKNRKIVDDEKFFEWFIASENARIGNTTVLVTTSRGPQTYANLNGGTQGVDLMHRSKLIYNDLIECPYVAKSIELDEERLFTPVQRYKLWEKQSGVCPATGKVIPESEINDYTIWQADHIIPHSLGGETTIDNGQLVCKDYNQSKSNKMPETLTV